jgi:hypothetical protein
VVKQSPAAKLALLPAGNFSARLLVRVFYSSLTTHVAFAIEETEISCWKVRSDMRMMKSFNCRLDALHFPPD